MNKKIIDRDIKLFLNRGYKEKLDKIYKKFPKTKCSACSVCCTDSPVITYPELLYIVHYLQQLKLTDGQKKQIIKNALREFLYGLIDPTLPCPFLDPENKCIIHKVAPVACKRWGLQSKEENDQDWETDYLANKEAKEYYLKRGIELSEEVINRRVPYCDKVTIINNLYNFSSNDFDKEADKIEPMIGYFGDKTIENFTLCSYMCYIVLGEKIFHKRIQLIREYNAGNKDVIDRFIDKIEIKCFF